MKRFIARVVLVVLGILGVISLVDALASLPEYFRFIARHLSELNASLGFEEEMALAVGIIVICAWAFDREIDRGKGPRKTHVGPIVISLLIGSGLLVSSFDRLDKDPWPEVALAANHALPAPVRSDDGVEPDSPGTSDDSAPEETQLDGELAHDAESGSGSGAEAFPSKDESGGCTCPPAANPELPPQESGREEANLPEKNQEWGEFEAEEAQEAAEEAREEAQEAAEEAQEEAEFGF
jgi:hypothetical protein